MAITNTSKPSTSFSSVTKPSFAELWSTITTTWATETRTWQETETLIDNISIGVSEDLWSHRRFPWLELTPWTSEGGISNVSKPA